MKIILSAVEAPLADAWQRFCGHLEGVTVHRGSILDLEVEAVVSPANSFGFMDGGIDALYSSFFGWRVQDAAVVVGQCCRNVTARAVRLENDLATIG